MPGAMKPEIIRFRQDMTLRWPCRRGDFLMWFGFSGIFSGPGAIRCYDLWEMRDGYHVTITNRFEDLPPWFRLHPSEICDSFVYKMYEQIERGDYPPSPMDAPNLWRLKSGDRVAWVGADRPERRAVDGILAVLDCDECALLVGEGDRGGLEEFAGFGCPSTPEMARQGLAICRAALKVVKSLGLPCTWGPDWMLG
jgi:hypothetical protein